MKKVLLVVLTFVLLVSMTACGQGSGASVAPVAEDESPEEQPADAEKKVYKVGLMVPSAITDQGWSQSGYEGILKIDENYDIEYSYIEQPEQSDVEEHLRNFGVSGYDIVFAHGFNFYDAILKVAPEFTDTVFVNGGSQAAIAPNLGSVDINSAEAGFLAGVVAGLVTETNKIGHVGGIEFPQLVDGLNGLTEGAKYVNPDAETVTAWVGDWEDSAKASGLVDAMAQADIDVVYENAGAAGRGAIEGCQENGIKAVGINIDKNFLAPDTVVTSVIVDYPTAMLYIFEEFIAGRFEPRFYYLGAKEDTVYYAPFYQFEEELGPENMALIRDTFDQVKSGELDVSKIVESVFY